jgi:16S rRNA (cytosine967-C5)-methyltransferase
VTPAARVSAAIEILDEILAGSAAEKALTNWARRSRFAGAKDRAAIRDHVFDALRCRRSFAALGGGETGRGLMIGELRAANADLSDIFSGLGHARASRLPGARSRGRGPRYA